MLGGDGGKCARNSWHESEKLRREKDRLLWMVKRWNVFILFDWFRIVHLKMLRPSMYISANPSWKVNPQTHFIYHGNTFWITGSKTWAYSLQSEFSYSSSTRIRVKHPRLNSSSALLTIGKVIGLTTTAVWIVKDQVYLLLDTKCKFWYI